MSLDMLKTGDLLLFNWKKSGFFGWFTSMIKWGTHSDYSHIAMVLRDPVYFGEQLQGLYVWESSWEGKPDPQDGKYKLGVQITKIDDILNEYRNNNSHVYIRRVNCDPSHFSPENMKKIHKVVYEKPYDIVPLDWVEALFQKDPEPQKTSRFWCSALVGYIYTNCGLLKSDTDWSIMRPNDFSLTGEKLNFMENVKLSDSMEKLF